MKSCGRSKVPCRFEVVGCTEVVRAHVLMFILGLVFSSSVSNRQTAVVQTATDACIQVFEQRGVSNSLLNITCCPELTYPENGLTVEGNLFRGTLQVL